MGVGAEIDQDAKNKGGVSDAVGSLKLTGIHLGVVRSTKSYRRDGKIVVYMSGSCITIFIRRIIIFIF